MTEVEKEREESEVEWGCCSEGGSWFQRHGEPYWKERSVIHREDDVGGRVRVTSDEERVLWGGWTVKRWCTYGGLVVVVRTDFVSRWKKLVFNAFSCLEPVKRAKYWSDVAGCVSMLVISPAITVFNLHTMHCAEITRRTPPTGYLFIALMLDGHDRSKERHCCVNCNHHLPIYEMYTCVATLPTTDNN